MAVFCREDGFWDRPLHEQDEAYEGVPVHRVYFNGRLDFQACYRNPVLDEAFRAFLLRFRPEVIHFQHLERLSAGFIDVAAQLGIPRVLTLHDFWFLCPQIQLLREGRICAGPDEGRSCVTCPGLLPEALRLRVLARARELWDAIPARRALRLFASRVAPQRLHAIVEASALARGVAECGVDLAATRERYRHLKDAFGRIDLVLSPSRFLLGLFRELGFDHPAAEYSDLGMPKLGAKRLSEPSASRVRFGCFSAVVAHKGIELLLHAFGRLRSTDAELVVRGQGSPRFEEEVRRLAAKDARIAFLPPYDEAGLAEAYSGIDVLVVPSLWYENSPIVIHEAALLGVPVIAGDVGGMAEYVKPGVNGLLFRRGDERDLTRTMQRFLDDPSLVGHLRQVPFEVKSMEEDAAALEAHYARLLEGRRERRSTPSP